MPGSLRIRGVFTKTLVFVVVGLIHAAAPNSLLAQAPPGAELRPVRITTPPKLDGILDDEAWTGNPLPLEGWSSYNRCAARHRRKRRKSDGYDDEALYLAFRCLDSQPEKIRTTISRRDNAFSEIGSA